MHPPLYGTSSTPLRCQCSVFPVQKSTTEQTRSSFGGVQKFSGERILWYVFLPHTFCTPPISRPKSKKNFMLKDFGLIFYSLVRQKERKLKLLGPDIFWRGGGQKAWYVPRNRETKFFGRISRDFAGISQGRPKRLRKRSLCSNFGPYLFSFGERSPGLIQLVLTVLVFWFRVLLEPRLPASSRSLRSCPRTSICSMAPSSKFLDLLPPAPPTTCAKHGTHSTSFLQQGDAHTHTHTHTHTPIQVWK